MTREEPVRVNAECLGELLHRRTCGVLDVAALDHPDVRARESRDLAELVAAQQAQLPRVPNPVPQRSQDASHLHKHLTQQGRRVKCVCSYDPVDPGVAP